jgi:hypothetical protein
MEQMARTHRPRPGRLAASSALVGLALSAGDALAQSCAMCGSSFGENDPVTRAFSWSILFLMATPYTIVGVIGGYLFYTYRRPPRRYPAAIIRLAQAARRLRRPAPAGSSEGDLT